MRTGALITVARKNRAAKGSAARLSLITICVLAALAAAGCSGEKKTETAASKPEEKAAPAVTKIDPATAATVTGKVKLDGKRPAKKSINMSEEAECRRLHKGAVYEESVVAGADGGLAYAFVYVKSGLEGKTFEAAKEPVKIDQRGCTFQPRVLGIRVGQTLSVSNSDPVSHNIHPMPKDNREWNQQQPPQAPGLEREFARPEVMIPVKCNVHAWMRSYIGVVDHPYFAVTGEQGVFELKGLPPGEYTIEAWQEKYGTLEQKVTLAASASQAIEFKFKGE